VVAEPDVAGGGRQLAERDIAEAASVRAAGGRGPVRGHRVVADAARAAVCLHVAGELARLGTRVRADAAAVWLLAGVRAPVDRQVAAVFEHLAAVLARVVAPACRRLHVRRRRRIPPVGARLGRVRRAAGRGPRALERRPRRKNGGGGHSGWKKDAVVGLLERSVERRLVRVRLHRANPFAVFGDGGIFVAVRHRRRVLDAATSNSWFSQRRLT